MSKLNVIIDIDKIYVAFTEYRDERQLKDIYKLYKKASGYTVREYKDEADGIFAQTDNETSVKIGRNEKYGCFISGSSKDSREIAQNVFDMLCYRYSMFKKYEEAINIREMGAIEIEKEVERISEDKEADEEMKADIRKIISIIN